MQVPRFYPILDTAVTARAGFTSVDAAQAILDGGARVLQLRHKDHFSREVFEWAEQIAQLCRDAGALLIVNDRADMAALLGAGLHLGQDDLAPADARRLLPSQTIGFSTHNFAQFEAAAAEPVDYVALGPIFHTGSKPNPDPVVGLSELRRLRHLTQRPIVAIGGIARGNAPAVWQAGADSVAVIGDLFSGVYTYSSLRTRVTEWCQLGEKPGMEAGLLDLE
jgi:thiamine-phosphate pyrophosphorylase